MDRRPQLTGTDWLFVGLFLLFALPAFGIAVAKIVEWTTP